MLIAVEEGWCIHLPPSQTVGEASKVVKSSLLMEMDIYVSSGASNYCKIKEGSLTKHLGSLESQ